MAREAPAAEWWLWDLQRSQGCNGLWRTPETSTWTRWVEPRGGSLAPAAAWPPGGREASGLHTDALPPGSSRTASVLRVVPQIPHLGMADLIQFKTKCTLSVT